MSDANSNSDDSEIGNIDRKYIPEYIGERSEEGKRDGYGKALLGDGSQYQGQYREGLRHGQGTFQFPNAAQYIGDWKKGLKHGNGKFNYPDGSWFWGEWKRNKRHGFGKYCYINGDIYEGRWQDDMKHGVGMYKYSSVEVIIKANWFENFPKGPIEIIFPNGIHYYGFWNKNDSVGEGVFSFSMKYMLPGHIELFPNLEAFEAFKIQYSEKINVHDSSNGGSSIGDHRSADNLVANQDKPVNPIKCLPRFVAHDIQAYDEKKLNHEAFAQLPESGSLSTICSQSSFSYTSEILMPSTEIQQSEFVTSESMKGEAGSLEKIEKIIGLDESEDIKL